MEEGITARAAHSFAYTWHQMHKTSIFAGESARAKIRTDFAQAAALISISNPGALPAAHGASGLRKKGDGGGGEARTQPAATVISKVRELFFRPNLSPRADLSRAG